MAGLAQSDQTCFRESSLHSRKSCAPRALHCSPTGSYCFSPLHSCLEVVHITGYCRHSNSLKQHFRLCDCETLKLRVIMCGIGSVYLLVTLLFVRNSSARFTNSQCVIVWTGLSVKMMKVMNLIGHDCHAHLKYNVKCATGHAGRHARVYLLQQHHELFSYFQKKKKMNSLLVLV